MPAVTKRPLKTGQGVNFEPVITVDDTVSADSDNPVSGRAVATHVNFAINNIQKVSEQQIKGLFN